MSSFSLLSAHFSVTNLGATVQCHFTLHLCFSASFFFVHLDHTLVQRVHNAQHNSAHRNLSITTNMHTLHYQNQRRLQFCILWLVDYMLQPHLKLLLCLGHQPPHTNALTRSLPLPPLLWTLQHLLPHS